MKSKKVSKKRTKKPGDKRGPVLKTAHDSFAWPPAHRLTRKQIDGLNKIVGPLNMKKENADRLIAGVEKIIDTHKNIYEKDEGTRPTAKEIRGEIATLQGKIGYLRDNLLNLYNNGSLHSAVRCALEDELILSGLDTPQNFIRYLGDDLTKLSNVLESAGENFTIKKGAPRASTPTYKQIAVDLAMLYKNASGIAPTSTVASDCIREDGHFAKLAKLTFESCGIFIADVKPFLLHAVKKSK